MSRESQTPLTDEQLATRRTRALRALVALLLVLVPTGIYMYQHRPNLYDRARTDLLEANRQLDIYSQDMEQLAQSDRDGTEALSATVAWLRHAAASDPADMAEISAITGDLQDWKREVSAGKLSSADLHANYLAIEKRVQRLIDKRTKPVPDR